MINNMSTSTEGLAVPQWDLSDRLAKSLKVGNVSVQEMADYLEVHRNTVSAWINGRITPSGQTIRLWALRTGVPYEWVRNGVEPSDSPDGPGGGKRHGDGTPDLRVRSQDATVTYITPVRAPIESDDEAA